MWAKKINSGFTIVELLIVIVIIAILAAISIVAYNGIQNRANNTTIETDMTNTAKKIELFKIDKSNYPLPSELDSIGIKVSKNSYALRNNFYYCISADSQSYAIGAISKTNQSYQILNGSVSKVSSTDSAAVCLLVGQSTWSTNWAATGQNSSGVWQSWVN